MAVIWLRAIIARSDLFCQKGPKLAASLCLALLISAALINARGNYRLIRTTVSSFIRNHPFESFQMGVHRLVS